MKTLLTIFLLGFLALTANAQVQVPNDFVAGQPARASEVNANFAALEDAINANAAALAGLEDPFSTVLDLSNRADCTIDTPGVYVLDRSWLITPSGSSNPPYGCAISIEAYATLDFRGFEIDVGDSWAGDIPVITVAAGVSATVRNGAIRSEDSAIEAPMASLVIHSMRISGQVDFQDGSVTASTVSGREDVAIRIRGNGIVRDSRVHCTVPCIESGLGSSALVSNNYIDGELYPTIVVSGPDNIVRNNTIIGSFLLNSGSDDSIVVWNTIDGDIDIMSAGNVLDNNLATGTFTFTATGNFYGDNRIRGLFQGAAGQTDWGGNVSY